jgi:hypothetical protein
MRRLRRWLGLPRWGWRWYALFFLVVFGLAAAAFMLTGALEAWRAQYDPLFAAPKDLKREDVEKFRKFLKE